MNPRRCLGSTSLARAALFSGTLLPMPQIEVDMDSSAASDSSFSILLKCSRVCHGAVCHQQPTMVHDRSINIHVWCSNSDSYELSISKEQIETFSEPQFGLPGS